MNSRRWLAVSGACALVAVFLAACAQGQSPEERLREHYDEVILPETEAALVPIAESCDRGAPGACQLFGLMVGEVATIRMARYWEAMHWLGVTEAGAEILPAVVAPLDDCDYLTVTVWGEYPPEDVGGLCSFFRSEQLPACSSGGSGSIEDSLAGFERCLEKAGELLEDE